MMTCSILLLPPVLVPMWSARWAVLLRAGQSLLEPRLVTAPDGQQTAEEPHQRSRWAAHLRASRRVPGPSLARRRPCRKSLVAHYGQPTRQQVQPGSFGKPSCIGCRVGRGGKAYRVLWRSSGYAPNHSGKGCSTGSGMTLKAGVVSTYPPTRCGIASFTAALAAALEPLAVSVRVVRLLNDGDGKPSRSPVVAEILDHDPASVPRAMRALEPCDVAIVQFEHGIFAGVDGAACVSLLERLSIPSVVVLHTVLRAPSPGQRLVVQHIAENVDVIVVMSDVAARRLVSRYGVPPTKVVVIPHGAALAGRPCELATFNPPVVAPQTILTWGLLGPGKGIESAIEAFALLRRRLPYAVYVIAGQTHPKVLARDGERYRDSLETKAKNLGITDAVVLDPTYYDLGRLSSLVRSADVVLLPYDSTDQACSGVLVEAVASGVPVVATRFPHAVELLATGAGLTVEHGDTASMASALKKVLMTPELSDSMRLSGLRLATDLTWESVANRYHSLLVRLVS